jgi:hypothetical protein
VSYLAVHVAVSMQTITGFKPYPPFTLLQIGARGRILTMLGVVPDIIRLLLWPARLSPEYGPPANPVVPDFQLYQLPGILIVAGAIGLGIATRRRVPSVSFGLWFMLITWLPSSNVLFPAAGFFSERTLFAPSVGLLIALGAVVPVSYRRLDWPVIRLGLAGAVIVLIVIGVARSSDQSRIWKNNDTLFERAVIDAPDVYRSHYMLGSLRFNEGRKAEGEREFKTAIALYDRDPAIFYLLGEEYRAAGNIQSAAEMYGRGVEADSTRPEIRARLALAYAELGRWPDADREAKRTLAGETSEAKAMLEIIRLAGAARRFPVVLREHPPSAGGVLPTGKAK